METIVIGREGINSSDTGNSPKQRDIFNQHPYSTDPDEGLLKTDNGGEVYEYNRTWWIGP